MTDTTQHVQELQWWAEGDAPVRTDSRVSYLIDGRSALLMMCRHFIKARHLIYLAGWGLTPTMELVRGSDRSGLPGQEQMLLQELREEGFSEQDVAFWRQQQLSLQSVLGYAVSKGVEVKVLLWKCGHIFSHYSPQKAHDELQTVGVTCILDDSSEGILHHPIESLHQKISIIDSSCAFVGGVDILIENKGEYDRWDTPDHPFHTPLRRNEEGKTPHPWHDVHSLIEGPAVADVEKNFRQRWNDRVNHHHWSEQMLIPQRPDPSPKHSASIVQVARTIPEHTYSFEPLIIRGIAQLYRHAFSNLQHVAYLENQYFWLRAYYGIDLSFVGNDNPEMLQNLETLGLALRRGAAVSLVLPDHPNVGRVFTDAGIQKLRAEAPQAVEEGRLEAFCLATSTTIEGREHYRPIYVHAKVAIIDDLWSTVGSANLNNRGMADDTEMNVATLDASLAHGLRLMLQGEHLGLVHAADLSALSRMLGRQVQTREGNERAQRVLLQLEEQLGDPLTALRLMHERAWENLRRYQANQPLIGHLLPYLTEEEARELGLPFRDRHGWIEEP